MRYNKSLLTFSQQADLLSSRGLSGNLEVIISRLQSVSYYRLNGYWHTLKQAKEYTVFLYGKKRKVGRTLRLVMLKTMKCPVRVCLGLSKTRYVALMTTDLTFSVG